MNTQNYARSITGTVQETWKAPDDLPTLTPADIFVPALAANFKRCPDEVQPGWLYDAPSDTYSAPTVTTYATGAGGGEQRPA